MYNVDKESEVDNKEERRIMRYLEKGDVRCMNFRYKRTKN